MTAERRSCNVADQACTAPANVDGCGTKAACFVCGLPVCTKCSSRRLYGRYGRVRICNTCQVEVLDGGSESRVMARLRRLVGA